MRSISRFVCELCFITMFVFSTYGQINKSYQMISADTSLFISEFTDVSNACFDSKTQNIYTIYEKANKHCYIEKINIKDYDTYLFSIDIDLETIDYLSCLCVSGDDFVICGPNIVLFYKKTGNIFVKQSQLNLDADTHIKECYFLPNGNIVLLEGYLGKGAITDFMHLILIDTPARKIQKRLTLDFALQGLSYREVHKLLTVTDESILFSQMGEYKIDEYDFNLNLINTISRDDFREKQYPKARMDSILYKYKNASSRLAYFYDMDDYFYIFRIYSNADRLIVFYSEPDNKYNGNFDVWRKTENKWQLQQKNICDGCLEKNNAGYRAKNYRLSAISMWSTYILFNENNIYTFRNLPPLTMSEQKRMTKRQLKRYLKDYYSKKSDVLMLDVFNINF